jgi:hypothetical protein
MFKYIKYSDFKSNIFYLHLWHCLYLDNALAAKHRNIFCYRHSPSRFGGEPDRHHGTWWGLGKGASLGQPAGSRKVLIMTCIIKDKVSTFF